jgi:hypothetical protein
MGMFKEAIIEVNCAKRAAGSNGTGAGVGAGDAMASAAYSELDVNVCFETISEFTKS